MRVMSEEIDTRDYEELSKSIALAQYTVYKKYLNDLSLFPIVKPSQVFLDESAENCIRLVKLEELAIKKGEDIFQKLTTVYHACMSLGCNLVVMIDVERIDAPANIYIGVKNDSLDETDKTNLSVSFRTLKGGLKSNFPGTKFKDVPSKEILPAKIEEIFGESVKYISSVSCIASRRDKAKTEDKSFVQGIERLIDAMHGNTYTAVFIAKPVSSDERVLIRDGYENIYSTLSSFRKSTWSYSSNESKSVMKSLSRGISKSITTGTTHTQSHTTSYGANLGINASVNSNISNAHMESKGSSSPTMAARAGQAMSGVAGVLGLVGKIVAPIKPPIVGGALLAANGILATVGGAMSGATNNHSVADTITNTIGKSLGISGGLNAGFSNTSADTTINTKTDTETNTETDANTDTKGTGKTLQIENVNKSIDNLLVRIDELLKRIQECEDYGAYNCSVYFVSGKQESCMLGANTFRALMIGEGTSLETGAINFWNGRKEPEKVETIKQYIKRFEHPIFAMPISDSLDCEEDFVKYNAGTIVSGLELPLHIGLPAKSVYGLPVIEHAEFGKEVVSYIDDTEEKRECEIGNIFSMGSKSDTKVKIDLDSLTMHTFITGSTGSGKSNSIYVLLNELRNTFKIPFMVIEPAKGEYKNIFGQFDDVKVYGTNPSKTDLLRINPFRFPINGVHVLEHMDRLVEVFNVCWPMYAAMPAILKEAIEKSYVEVGWDLSNSINSSGNVFPDFNILFEQIERVINESRYSSESKGDYVGALLTRVRSLTTGLNHFIFSKNDITDEDLYDKNVIVDLSRVGSVETKSLIMGLLVLKLNEYRMEKGKMNSSLTHVTVLEEAHNLLKKTSSDQSMDKSNLVGKSVEMIANSIAEMRTYGEGFVIADQAPGLLDLSVIRNTNTKIILRLPDKDDRELVGYSAGLTDEQISELAKLKKGVAAIYQNDWVEPILVQINKDKTEEKEYEYSRKSKDNLNLIQQDKLDISDFLRMVLFEEKRIELSKEKKNKIVDWIDNLSIVSSSKRMLKRVLAGDVLTEKERRELCYNAFGGRKVANALLESIDDKEAISIVDSWIGNDLNISQKDLIEIIRNNIIYKASEIKIAADLPHRYGVFMGGADDRRL